MKRRKWTCVAIFLIGWFVVVLDSRAQDTSEDRCGSISALMNTLDSLRPLFEDVRTKDYLPNNISDDLYKVSKRVLAKKKCYLAQIDNDLEVLVNPEERSILPTLKESLTSFQSLQDRLPEEYPEEARDMVKGHMQTLKLAIDKWGNQPNDHNTEGERHLAVFVSVVVNIAFSTLEVQTALLNKKISVRKAEKIVNAIVHNHKSWNGAVLMPFLGNHSHSLQLESVNPLAYRLKQLLGRDLAPRKVNPDGWTDLHYAAVLNLPWHTKQLLELDAPVDAQLLTSGEACSKELWFRLRHIERDLGDWMKRLGQTPLHVAARFNSREAAEELIHAGADIQAKSIYGTTPLHYAARGDSDRVAKLLIEKGANIGSSNNENQTPLHYAARHCSRKVVELLIEKDVILNVQDSMGQTPLHQAMQCGFSGIRKKIIEKLLDNGARADLKDEKGAIPLDHLKALENLERR